MSQTFVDPPLISALVTTFNHERFIDAAIQSLLTQDYPNVEIIVVDDGSQDATVDRLSRYQSDGVILLHTPNLGPSLAMNMAMSKATGDIFLLQSGDDMSAPMRAVRQLESLKSADLVACHPQLVDDSGNRLDDNRFATFFRMSSASSMEQLFASLYLEGNFLCASSVAMRRSLWEKLGGFHPGLLQLQDYEYWLRALANGFSIALDADRFIFYRLHSSNLSDMRHNIRTQREMATLLRQLDTVIPESYLTFVLYGNSFNGIQWSANERKMLSALFFLRHSSELVRQIGVDILIGIVGDPQINKDIRDRFGITGQDIFQALLYS